jgi:hypothetical protein
MKKQYVILFIIFSSLNIMGQDTGVVCRYHAWGFYPCITYYQMNFTNINSAGWMIGRPKNTQVMVGAGANYGNPTSFYVSGDISFDVLTVQAASGSYGVDPTVDISYASLRLSFNGYYPLIKKVKYGVYANIGTSFERISLLSENENTKNSEDTITVFENFTLSQNLLVNGGLSFYFYNKKFGFATGLFALRLGYNWAPLKPSDFNWYNYDGNTRTQTNPSISFEGFYAGIALNIWFTNNVVCKFH